MHFHLDMLRLYFIAGSQDCRHLGNGSEHLLRILHSALQAGISCYQLRDKGEFSLQNSPSLQKQLAKDCQKLCQQHRVPFIVNDDVDLALDIGADGIHVGQTDRSVFEISQAIKRPMIIGLSVNTVEQARRSDDIAAVDYFGVGPVFATNSKADHRPPIGLNFVQTLRNQGIKKPIVSIGGVKPQHVSTLRQNGAQGVAVISAITQADDVAAVVQAFLAHDTPQ